MPQEWDENGNPIQEQWDENGKPIPSSGAFALGATEMRPDTRQERFLRNLGSQIPLGMQILGSSVGSPGGTPGRALGGAAGAGAGELLRQRLSVAMGGEQLSPQESLMRAGEEAVLGGTAEAVGNKAAEGLPGLFRRKLTPIQQRDIRLLEREGIPYTAGDIRPSGAANQVEGYLRATMLGGRRAEQSEHVQRIALKEFQDRVLDKIGPLASAEETGAALQSAVKGRHQELVGPGGIFDRAYKRLTSLYPARVNTQQIRNAVAPIKAELDKLTSEGRVGAAAVSKESPSRFLDLVNRLARYGTTEVPAQPPSSILNEFGSPMRGATSPRRIELPLTYKDVWQDKQTLDAAVRSMSADDPLRTRAKGLLKRLDAILDDAMQSTAEGTSPEAAARIKSINTAYAETKRLFETESLVSDIGNMDPERIVNRFFSPGSVTGPRELLSVIKSRPDLKPLLRRRVIENLFDSLGRDIEGVRVTPAGALRERFRKASPSLKVLLTQDQINGIEEFINAASRSQASGRMLNPQSGRQLVAQGQLISSGGALTAAATGNFSVALAAGSLVLAPEALSRAMFNPQLSRLLAKGFTISPGTAEYARWLPRVIEGLGLWTFQGGKRPLGLPTVRR